MYAEMFSGLTQDPARHLKVTFPENYDEMVLVRDIRFTSMCEHHLLPFSGVAHVAYIPNGRVTGLSKLARVVEEVARRPQVQERLTQHVADLIENELDSKGVAIVISAERDVHVKLMSNHAGDEAYVTIDGQTGFELHPSDEIAISRSERRLRLVRATTRSYFEVLRQKLKWNER